MSAYIPALIRQLVSQRAAGICEYCLMHQDFSMYICEIDHVMATKH
jgi:hypothetical protein